VADVAVVAHAGKTLGGGLPELREILATEGVTNPLWYEVKKSRRAPEFARKAAAKGADVLFVWGGDGTVQRCIDAVAGTDTAVAILPAGTRTYWPRTCGYRTISPRRCGSACTGTGAGSTAGR
jgi:diacylglycerol kinase family enzyme